MELLAPAGSLEKLKYAVLYGADSVYTAGKDFGLRAKAANLTEKEMVEAVEFCHNHQKQIYVAINIFAHNRDIEALPSYIRFLRDTGVDAVIVSDPGVLMLVRETAPELAIHLSTQANTTSYKSVLFWKEQNVKRIILARELTFSEIREIRRQVPDIELEMFIHGAMCISYSGRCLLSSFLNLTTKSTSNITLTTNRKSKENVGTEQCSVRTQFSGQDSRVSGQANRGLCTHPCRWEYRLFEESRPGEYFPIEEDERGSYILNSKDLCLFEKLPHIICSGIDAVKIEGRMKSLYYVANTARVYKTAIRGIEEALSRTEFGNCSGGNFNSPAVCCTPCTKDGETYRMLRDELDKVSHREWTTGFFDKGDANCEAIGDSCQNYDSSGYIRDYQFLGEVTGVEPANEDIAGNGQVMLIINVRAKFMVGETIDLILPDITADEQIYIDRIFDENNVPLQETKPNTSVKLISSNIHALHGILRKPISRGKVER